jgi:hypothetical protein
VLLCSKTLLALQPHHPQKIIEKPNGIKNPRRI